MEVYVKNWYECPFRFEPEPKEKVISSHRYYHESHYKKYAEGLCVFSLFSDGIRLVCPRTWITHKAKQLVGAAPSECPLRHEPIIMKPGPNL